MARALRKIKFSPRRDRGFAANLAQRQARADAARGFTLLELVVALAIMGSMLAVVAINGVKFLERYREQVAFRDIRSQISLTRYRALAENRRIGLDGQDAEISLPAGWRIETAAPIYYMPSGACLGGELSITAPSGRTERWRLDPPDCQFAAAQG